MSDVRQPASRRTSAKILTGLLLGLVAMLMFSPSPANAWWNDEWQLRKKITIDASASGAGVTDPIGATPVLIRLHVGNFRFGQAKDDGSDLRFVAGDDKTPLKHHIEKFDSLLGEALIWVAAPSLQPGAKADLWLYYGNKKALATSDPKGAYDPDTVLVYHFSERGAAAVDSSTWMNNAQSVGQPADGAIIGTGLRLEGRAPLMLPASPSLALTAADAFTWSAWIKPASLQPNAAIYSRRDTGGGIVIGLDNGAPFVEVGNASGVVQRSGAGAPMAANEWRHLAVVANSGQVMIYLDGNPYASLAASLPALNTIALIGGDTPTRAASLAAATAAPDPAAAPQQNAPAGTAADGSAAASNASAAAGNTAPAAMTGFSGDIDELQIAKIARSPGFLRIAAIGQGADFDKLVNFSVDEEAASWMSGYLAVILKSVTFDGWVIIGILMIMAAISWVVMYDRASYLNRQSRANATFIKDFRKGSSDLTALDMAVGGVDARHRLGMTEAEARLMRASSLYRIYHIGAEQIRVRLAQNGNRTTVLAGSSIAAIRAALDSGYVKETQRLNRLMVLLTIAISGGPFLGLLGTVVGVMITFAAIAQSGDVNVNAIAPGIAAALVATVAGLLVAIPALFGYNYLISRIKNLTTDMQVFIDELVTKMAEFYGPDRAEQDPGHSHSAAE